MAYGTEVKATLGVDTTKVPEDMAKAREAFKKAGSEIEGDSAKTGDGAGDKFSRALEHRILGARHLSGALAVALGLNIDKVAEKITSAIVGGAKEGWKEALSISEQNARLIEAIIEARLSPAQLEAKHKKDLTRAIDAKPEADTATSVREAIGAQGLQGQFVAKFLGLLGLGKTKADELKETEELTAKVLEAQAKVEEDKRDTKKELVSLSDQDLSTSEKSGTLAQREAAIREHIKVLATSIVKDNLTEVEIAKKRVEIKQKENDLYAIHRDMQEKDLAAQKRTNELEAQRAALAEKRTALGKDEAKLTDRSKLTVGELATIRVSRENDLERFTRESEEDRARHSQFGSGLSSEQIAAQDKAIEIQRLTKKAEEARLGGDKGTNADLLGKIGTLRDELVSSGFTKTTEGDPATLLREQIAKDNTDIKKTLSSIEVIEKGKYINQ